MNYLKSVIIVALFTFTNNCLAEKDNYHINKLNFCKLTAKAHNDYEPETFLSTNNLLRKTGEQPLYCGEKIIVHGRVLDQNCAPVADAKVYMWQVNCKGKYPYKPLRNRIDQSLIHIDEGLTFTGNGVATTNNLGEFYFVTVFPASVHHMGSHVNIRVEDRRLGNLQTKFILKNHKVMDPELDLELSRISEIASQNDISIYDVKIVMPGDGMKSY
jgi:protocatechuate 3,4-dioxygenase beta subunit